MSDDPIRPLTPRERQVADGIGRGLSYREIGLELHIATRTVEALVRSITLKFVRGPNDDELSPRDTIFLWVKHRQWLEAHAKDTGKAA